MADRRSKQRGACASQLRGTAIKGFDRYSTFVGFYQEMPFGHGSQRFGMVMHTERKDESMPRQCQCQLFPAPETVDNPRRMRTQGTLECQQLIGSFDRMDNQGKAVLVGKSTYGAERFFLQGKRRRAPFIQPRLAQRHHPYIALCHRFHPAQLCRKVPGGKIPRMNAR